MSDKQQLLVVGGSPNQKELVKKFFNVQVRFWDKDDVGRGLPDVHHIYVWKSTDGTPIGKHVSACILKHSDSIMRCQQVSTIKELYAAIRDDGYELRRHANGPLVGKPLLFTEYADLDNSPNIPRQLQVIALTRIPENTPRAIDDGLDFDHLNIPDDTHTSKGSMHRGLLTDHIIPQIVKDVRKIKSGLLASQRISVELKKRYNFTVDPQSVRNVIQKMRDSVGLVRHRRPVVSVPAANIHTGGWSPVKQAPTRTAGLKNLDDLVNKLTQARALMDQTAKEIKDALAEYATAFSDVERLKKENDDLKAKISMMKEALSL